MFVVVVVVVVDIYMASAPPKLGWCPFWRRALAAGSSST